MNSDKVQNTLSKTIEKPIKRSVIESTKRSQSPYFQAFSIFKQDLDLLAQLNRKLPKSAEKIMKKEMEKSMKKMASSGKPVLEELKKFSDFITSAVERARDAKKGVKKKPISIKLNMSKEASSAFMKMIMAFSYSHGLNKFVRNMSLVYLVTEFESFLRSILEATYKARPEILIYCQKTVTYEELMASGNIDDMRRQIMDKESSSIINQDIEEVGKYLEQQFHLDLAESKDWSRFKERFYRRNVLVHNSGKIDRLYRLKTGYRGRDKTLIVSGNYLKDSIDLFGRTAMEISDHFYGKFK
jgi:hypothetical protein